jgi:hypothetical protein
MPDSFYYFITVAFAAFLAPWIVGPIVVYFVQRTAFPEFLSLSDAEMEPLTSTDFDRRSDAVEELGFERVCNVQWMSGSAIMYSRLFCNSRTQESASVSDVCTNLKYLPTPAVRAHLTEFVTDFYDAPQINTSNAKFPRVFDYGLEKQIHSLPGVYEAETIYRAHRHLTDKISHPVKPLPPVHLVRQEFETEGIDMLRQQVEAGILSFNEEGQVFRPTVMGAISMTWKLAWPVGMIKRAEMRRNARRLLAAARA